MTNRINTCRFCGGRAHPSWLIKYGTRAYAHFGCFAAHKTPADVETLPQYERHRFEAWREQQRQEVKR